MLKDPILQAKELAALPDADQSMQLFMKIFNLESDAKKESNDGAKEEEKEAFSPIVRPSIQV